MRQSFFSNTQSVRQDTQQDQKFKELVERRIQANKVLQEKYKDSNLKANANDENIDQKIEKMIEENTFYQIKDMYENSLKIYVDGLDKNETMFCLNCRTTENLKKCSKCKKVYFCGVECQKKCHKLHRFDCNE